MKLVTEFDRTTFLEVGRKKLQIISRVETDEDKEKLLDEAKNGASVRELEGKKKELDEGKKPPKEKGKEAVDTKGEGGRPKQEDQSITLLAKVGGRSKTYNFRNRKTHIEVQSWEKDSYVEISISDLVTQIIVLKADDKGSIIGVTIGFRKIEQQS